ncbi:MAG: metal-dependent hydrolase [Caldilineaceae bacterium SB0670_bin_27]|uniref:Metal-dependent hydrolase n=1 Tax=Caldilineaceae bacterium SB0664_bin_27 TaxID=2605260 RepID=A0A6B0YVQ6_9CHLR|nr:metal-dependent hydrolase [Caldilineaceae bacterium SB0664_bin_27]MYJ78340.1 metal-dependent hydrolase [Caldilineaceae bacterium SB0670_bin_27]
MPASSAREDAIDKIRRLPLQVEELVSGLSPQELTAKPLAGEWTVAQNVHHIADSHINSYVRCKLMATEDNPTLKPYDEGAWALLSDGSSADLSDSLTLLKALHARWVQFWENLPDDAWQRTGMHPESGPVTLARQLELYVEHGEAHLDQIRRTLTASKR